MSENISHFEVERGSERSFGAVFALFFLIITGYVFFTRGEIIYWALISSGIFGVISCFWPKLLKPLNFLWFKLGMLLGAIVGPLVMMIIFFLVVTPIGLIMRAFGKDSLRLKKNPQQDTYWADCHPDDDQISSMKNQF